MSESADEKSILLEEKPLEDEGDHVLRLIQIEGDKKQPSALPFDSRPGYLDLWR